MSHEPTRRQALRGFAWGARAATATALAAAALLAGCASLVTPAEPLKVKVLAINDFHGYLKPSSGGIRIADPADRSKTITVTAGGAEHLATAVQQLKSQNPNHVFVAAGDLIGGTPLLSALFRDEPTIEALSAMGLAMSAVGNHEFDRGAAELLRIQNGGCQWKSQPAGSPPLQGACQGPQPYRGAGFQYLAASTIEKATGKPLLPPYAIRRFEGVPVAFIGLTLKATPSIVVPAGVAGLEFRDEAETVNALVPELKRQGVEAIVVLLHEGGLPTGDYNECPGISGPVVDIVQKLDKAVDVVISGHTHRAYNCRIDGRLVTSGHQYGTIVTQIDLTIDRKTRDVVASVADNVIVRTDTFAKDPRISQLIATYEQLARPLAQRVVGRIAAPLPRDAAPNGESPMGQVIADAQLAATRDAGAQVALMNPGGIRAALPRPADGQIRYEDLFAIQPFSNNLVTMTLSGAQLVELLEQQWAGQGSARLLQVSRGFSYTWDAAKPVGQRVVPGSLRIDGKPVAAGDRVRVTVNSFMASGGDGFRVLNAGTERRTGLMDIDALERFVGANPQLAPGAPDRITRLN